MNIDEVNAYLLRVWDRWDEMSDEEHHEEFLAYLAQREAEYDRAFGVKR